MAAAPGRGWRDARAGAGLLDCRSTRVGRPTRVSGRWLAADAGVVFGYPIAFRPPAGRRD